MPVLRQDLEAREQATLAPYAQFSGATRGRQHREDPPEFRTHFQRDRDRVIHSRAFRRLEYKTQVFLNGSGDHYRTRLTHTIEVAAISRNVARALGLNEDLAETIALAHDLGHSPFGHKGEAVLNRLMRQHGGFEHNRHSLRIVEEIERKYPDFAGLNLTWETREGLLKHSTVYDLPGPDPGFIARQPSLEAQVANVCDEIAYYSHDLDDSLEAGLIREEHLVAEVDLWQQAARSVRAEHGALPDECRRYYTIRCIIDSQVKDVVQTSQDLIERAGIRSSDGARAHASPLIRYSAERKRANLQLRKYLYKHFYGHPEVLRPNAQAVAWMEELFSYYLKHPRRLGDRARHRIRKLGLERSICDYIAGMTDLYVIKEHERIFSLRGSAPEGRRKAG